MRSLLKLTGKKIREIEFGEPINYKGTTIYLIGLEGDVLDFAADTDDDNEKRLIYVNTGRVGKKGFLSKDAISEQKVDFNQGNFSSYVHITLANAKIKSWERQKQ